MHGMMRVGNPAAAVHLGRIARAVVLAACVLAAGRTVFAADTDLVVLRSGDRMHGEIKGLQYGQLQLKTTTMGTVYVEWDKIVELASPNFFEIEITDGARYYGSFQQVSEGTLGIALEGQTTSVDVWLVVRIRPIKSSFWDRIDGSISFGASYTKSSDIGQGSVSVTLGVRRPRYEYSTKFDTTVTVQPDVPDKSRTAGSASYLRLLRNRWYIPATVMFERNTDLGLDLRSSLGGGFGRYFLQSNRSLLRAGAGLVVNQENPVEGESTGNTEASLAASYSFFTYDYPKTNISTSFVLFPSLNVGGRYRTQLDVSISREIVTNFTVGVTAYDSYDSKPPAGSSSTHDFGMTLSVGWTF
jgi:putative salt-induced outer membrane protein YdiY